MTFATDKRIKDNMRTRSSSRLASCRGELPPPSRDVPRSALTRGSALARLLQIYSARVERLTLAVENSEYQIPAMTLSAAMLGEHLGSWNDPHS